MTHDRTDSLLGSSICAHNSQGHNNGAIYSTTGDLLWLFVKAALNNCNISILDLAI